ncbi:zinc finger protein 180-like isoform X3 [Bolinopsis microptera]|uniref:zinc finger protein 180-like isoform X3 n=1 Tax=Bolinopsis microptera TaxID=2820187 RepID=UPI00307952AE
MDHGLPEEIMEGDEVERQNNWSEREWTDDYEDPNRPGVSQNPNILAMQMEQFDVTDADLQPSTSDMSDLSECHPTLGDEYPRVKECLYIKWVEDEGSEEAPGWYFGTVESITDDGNFLILYADNATEVLDLTKVEFVLAKPGGKFFLQVEPKVYKPRRKKKPKNNAMKPRKSAVKRSPKKQAPLQVVEEEEEEEEEDEGVAEGDGLEDTEESSRDIIRKVLRQYEEQQASLDPDHHEEDIREEAHEDDDMGSDTEHIAMEQRRGPQEQDANMIIEEEEEEEEEDIVDEDQELQHEPQPMVSNEDHVEQPDEPEVPVRYIESGNIIIPSNIAARHPQSQIILVQRGPNGELEEVTQTQELQAEEVPEEPPLPVATIIEETTQVNGVEGHIEEEHEYEVEEEQPEQELEGDDSATEIVYPDDEEEEASDEEGEDRHASIEIHDKMRPVYVRRSNATEVVVDRNGNQVLQRGNVQLVRRMDTEEYMPPHSSEQVERYDGRIISSEQMMMSNRTQFSGRDEASRRGGRGGYDEQGSQPMQQRDVENYNQIGYQDDEHADDLERLQGRLITEDAMNMLDHDKGEGEDDDYSGDDEQDPRMPRRRGKYVRKTPEELDQVPRPWQCEFCPRAFPNKYHLQIHLRTHTGEKPYRCTECDMAFSHSSNLCSHIRTHNGIKPYKCKHCGKEFGRSNNMKAHTRIHTGEKPFECRFCGKAFRFGNHLTIHERSHTGERPYKCTYCDRAFRNSSNLRTHERLHTDERPYRCRYCDRAFSGSGNLHAHERVHTGERPFQCDVCSKAFSQSSTLRIHQRIHTGDKRYQCSLCGRRFIQSNHLKTHLRRMHHIDDSLPSIRTMHKADPYGMQSLNPNHYRVVTKQEPDDMDHYDREMQKPTMLKAPKQDRMDTLRPSPLIVDDDVRAKTWGPGSPLLHGDVENHRNH